MSILSQLKVEKLVKASKSSQCVTYFRCRSKNVRQCSRKITHTLSWGKNTPTEKHIHWFTGYFLPRVHLLLIHFMAQKVFQYCTSECPLPAAAGCLGYGLVYPRKKQYL